MLLYFPIGCPPEHRHGEALSAVAYAKVLIL